MPPSVHRPIVGLPEEAAALLAQRTAAAAQAPTDRLQHSDEDSDDDVFADARMSVSGRSEDDGGSDRDAGTSGEPSSKRVNVKLW